MIGDVSIGGVYLPTLLLLGALACLLTKLAGDLLRSLGFYRIAVGPAVVDLCLFAFILGGLALFTEGTRA